MDGKQRRQQFTKFGSVVRLVEFAQQVSVVVTLTHNLSSQVDLVIGISLVIYDYYQTEQ